jgi:translation initiation factor 4A
MAETNKQIIDYCKITSFEELNQAVDTDFVNIPKFNDKLIRGVYSYGFETPTYIQSIGIRAIATRRDVIGQAQSGTGKTGTFAIGLLNNIDEKLNEIQGIILVHTNEMVLQIAGVIREISDYTKIRHTVCAKNVSVRDNISALTGQSTDGLLPHIIIATPGRMVDMLNRTTREGDYIINPETVRTLVLDEADELLGTTDKRRRDGKVYNNFIDQIKQIISLLNKDTQICLFSATMNKEFFEITEHFMRDPLKILLRTEEITLEGIKQYYIEINEANKVSVILDLYQLLNISKCIIYCNSKSGVDKLHKILTEENHMCSIIHGDMSTVDRKDAMDQFRRNKSNVLISTDLIGRGIDIQQLSTVINYDIPRNIDSYIHRIGRSGRHGRKGVAINLVTERDMRQIDFIRTHYSTQIEPLPENVEEILSN